MASRRYKKSSKNKTVRRRYLALKKRTNNNPAKRSATRAAYATKSARSAAYSAALM